MRRRPELFGIIFTSSSAPDEVWATTSSVLSSFIGTGQVHRLSLRCPPENIQRNLRGESLGREPGAGRAFLPLSKLVTVRVGRRSPSPCNTKEAMQVQLDHPGCRRIKILLAMLRRARSSTQPATSWSYSRGPTTAGLRRALRSRITSPTTAKTNPSTA